MSRAARGKLLSTGYVVAGLVAGLAAAFLTYGGETLHKTRQAGVFLAVGLVAGLIHMAVQLRGAGLAIPLLGLLFLGQLVLNRPLRATSVIGAAFFAVPVGSALVGSSLLFKLLRRVPIGRFIIMGIVVALGYALMVAAFLLCLRQNPFSFLVWEQAVIGAKLGATLGLGFELVDLLARLGRHEEGA